MLAYGLNWHFITPCYWKTLHTSLYGIRWGTQKFWEMLKKFI